MSICTLVLPDRRVRIEFTDTPLLSDLLERSGVRLLHPCGGSGRCGKCAVQTISGDISEMTEAEARFGRRLACQIRLFGDAEVELSEESDMTQIETESFLYHICLDPKRGGLGAAIDIGTTTIAASLYDLDTGTLLRTVGFRNPQGSVAADVMSRIDASLHGKREILKTLIGDGIRSVLRGFSEPERKVESAVITGNTTMLYLLTGRDPVSLSKAPFEADCLFDTEMPDFEADIYYPPCMNAFVGADISCAVLYAGQCDSDQTTLLCDIGTNGEIALKKGDTLYVTSTAAGPAFEGAGISMGCGSIAGAIDKVFIQDDSLKIHTIGEKKAVGICGSGIVDAVACFLELGVIDEMGSMEEEKIELTPEVSMTRGDISALQLAKAAIAAGIQTLLESADTSADEITRVYIAGGFGKHLDPRSIRRIGLLPDALIDKCEVIGNAALKGAAMLLLDQANLPKVRRIAGMSVHVNLGGNPDFNMNYMEQMLFPEVQ